MEEGAIVQAGQVLPISLSLLPRPLLSVLQLSGVPTGGCAHFKPLSCTLTRTQLCPYSRRLFW